MRDRSIGAGTPRTTYGEAGCLRAAWNSTREESRRHNTAHIQKSNGFDGRLGNNAKIEKAKRIHNELQVDIAAYNEHRITMKHTLNKVSFNRLFWGGEAE
jgi:hypothetical protein